MHQERIFLENINYKISEYKIHKLNPGAFLSINLTKTKLLMAILIFQKLLGNLLPNIADIKNIKESYWNDMELKYCTKGILNENMPFITFDEKGVSTTQKILKILIKGNHLLSLKMNFQNTGLIMLVKLAVMV